MAVQEYVGFAKAAYQERGYRFRRIGNFDRLLDHFPSLFEEMNDLESDTAQSGGATIIMAFDYNGREEIVRAVGRILAAGRSQDALDAESFREFLDTGSIPDPDVLIRTGGDRRLSGFLTYQLEYTELFFCDELLPDFEIRKMTEIFQAYSDRRYSQ